MTHIAQLETGQANATALVLGDSLAYEAVEAKSAKDALLQRQYNIDELRNSIKTTINKRRTIEKLRAGGNIKPERVNEALDDLEEAAKHEQTLQHRVEAISRNLRPALQTHLRTMNDDMLSIALGQARTMLAYENRKLQIYEGIHAKIAKIPERGSMDQSAIFYHQPPQAESSGPTGLPAAHSAGASASSQSTAPQAAHMSPSSSSQRMAASTSALDQSMVQSKFMATQAAIKADMEAQREREERQRAQFAQARAYQHQKQASLGRASGAAAAPSQTAESTAPVASTASMTSQTPVSPPRHQQNISQPQSPLHAGVPGPSMQNGNQSTQVGNMSQSMFMPNPGRPVPQSPSRVQRTASVTHTPAGGVDPLSPGGPLAPSTSALPGQSIPPVATQQYQQRYPYQQQQPVQSDRPSGGPLANGSMTQSVFLPGRNAQPSMRPAQNLADERKRADARKAASFLAGAF